MERDCKCDMGLKSHHNCILCKATAYFISKIIFKLGNRMITQQHPPPAIPFSSDPSFM